MELTQLRYVLAIAESGNFSRAALTSNVTQPSLSQQIAKLEKELGHKLFHRLGRKAVATEAGEILIERARKILFEVDNVGQEIRDNPDVQRTISVGAIPTVAPYVLPGIIKRCQTQLPNLRINTEEALRTKLIRDVTNGRLDMAILARPVEEPQLAVETIFTESLVLAVGRRHPLASKRKFSAKDLADETFIMLGESSTLTQQVQTYFGTHQFRPHIGHTCAQVETLKDLVALNLGVTLLPRLAQSPDDHSRLIYRELSGRTPSREIAVVRHLQRYQTSGATAFLGLLREAFRGFAEPVRKA